ILVFFVASSFQPQRPIITRWVIATGCSLKVDGSTNVNKFTCAISNYSKPDTILVTQSTRPVVQLTGSMQLDVNRFDCFNPMMTADLRKTLKAKEFPHLTIKFISINHYPLSTEANTVTQGIVVIELAGISRTYSVNYRIISASRNFVNLVGFQQLKFSDFKITPPRKIGGMIKTNNDLTVVFDLKLKVIP
ncbi:MAG TPA: hypothetical protein VGD33_11235, partial [Chitinophagaceae bacterium]